MKELKELISELSYEHKNFRTMQALIKLVKNLDKIPVEKIEKLADV